MPDSDGTTEESAVEAEDVSEESSDDLQSLPKVIPPKTTAPFQFNQQVNIQQIPSKVWDRLAPDQIVDLSKSMLDQIEKMDARHFDFAIKQAERASQVRKQSVFVGGAVALLGFAAVTYLSATGNGIVAGIIATFLATIIAVIVGNKMLE
ncbi:MAG TPA: hypothetical protein VML01_14645 [Bryobacterales bacterium]|nr:hypothetical protein [Bryobacterales bacterium]